MAQFAAPECLRAIATPGVSTDAALVVLQSLVSRMEAMADGPYRVEHDQSKNLLTYRDLLQRYIRHEDVVTFRQSEIARITFPLKLQSVTQVDSRNSPAVQLADQLQVGPFRGFMRQETVDLSHDITLVYGANGTGKSSFCEALEVAMLGSISEAQAKRVDQRT